MPHFLITSKGKQFLTSIEGTKTEAMALARKIVAERPRGLEFPVSVHQSNGKNYRTKVVGTIKGPSTRTNPVSKSPNLLTGATILKSTRNAAGVVKTITVRLRDGLGMNGKPKSTGKGKGPVKRSNPTRHKPTFAAYKKAVQAVNKYETALREKGKGSWSVLQNLKTKARKALKAYEQYENRNA